MDNHKHSIIYGNRKINYTLSLNKKKSLSITVYPDRTVIVRAPQNKLIDEINYKIRKRASWIIKQLDYFEQFQPLPTERRYISGETHIYLGRQYRLKIIHSNSDGVKLKGKYLWVSISKHSNSKKVKKLVLEWYRIHAINLISNKHSELIKKASKFKLPDHNIQYRQMKKRWGSCTGKNNILINTELIKAPTYCIDYVIAHELCHLVHKNHGPKFWQLLSQLVPDWEIRRRRLEKVLI